MEYVRFQRGTQAAYNALTTKDKDTLYFIYDPTNSGVGALYMGDRIISGGDIVLESATLADLKDVLVESVKENSFLVQNKDGNWDNLDVEAVAALIKTYLGDIASAANVFQTDLLDTDADHMAAIDRVAGEALLSAGDIAVVKELIAGDKYQHTAYVYDNDGNWMAMDGNYSVMNVFTKEDIQVTSKVGELAANTTVAAGTAVGELLVRILSQSKNPSKTNPYISAFTVTNNGSGSNFEAGTSITPKWSASFNAGKYTYNSSVSDVDIVPVSGTGVVVNSWEITKDGVAIGSAASGTGDAFVLGDDAVTFVATANYSDGNYALTNLNKLPETEVRIAAASDDASATITSYRKMFAGGTTASEITSDLIRGLGANSAASISGLEFQANVGDTMLVFAFPASLTSADPSFEYFTMAWESVSGFVKLANPVKVADVRGGENGLMDYTVYTYTPAAAYAADTKYRVSF